MNHHFKNFKSGYVFIMNERIQSFKWLFRTLLNSMGGKFPSTVMTNQAFYMAVTIELVFSGVQHKLYGFQIIENSRKHIGALREKEGFMEIV